MKTSTKVFLLAAVLFCFAAFPASAQDKVEADGNTVVTSRMVADTILMYIPNRIMDLLDIFSIKLESGATAKLRVRTTHAIGLGFGVGPAGMVEWGYARRYGAALDTFNEIFFLADGYYDLKREYTHGNLTEFWYEDQGMQFPGDALFTQHKACDYWALELEVAALVGLKVAFHPLGLADFVCGIFCYDGISRDDYKLLVH